MKTTSPFDGPLVDGNYLSHPSDVDVMIEAIKEFYRVVINSNDSEIKSMINFTSNCAKCDNSSITCDQFLSCLAKEHLIPLNHLVGTCRIGSSTDNNTVVDERLRVKGFVALRVIDSSVMPETIEPGPYGTTIMIGERGAQFIKDDN